MDAATLTSSNSLIAPNAPLSGTFRAIAPDSLPVAEMLNVSFCKLVKFELNVKLTWHVVGAVSAPWQESPITVNGLPDETVNGGVGTAANVTVPDPVMFNVTVPGALVYGDGVPVGTPNDKLPGEAVTDCACAAG